MKLTIEQKMERVKAFLKQNDIPFKENVWDKMSRKLDIYIPSFRIVIHPGDDQKFYKRVRFDYHPVFVREEDTLSFVLEKVKNTITRLM